ncbi:heavy metal-responsive transcriptional regulator [Candidatus Synechococcus calcipolaris G9]|uniref:Heavy metal-responsive transcriptional regulator n=1 Tax=Candidatus Synechococcus calcipolaris G9 TaxID=1497997 RepID=A0ABT6F3C4_9SYNE|nr:heavy metal-responsive transcriptional regulator [Candidatus Synechococcus calcipolaris]MDG2992278.1 heavy metal-responsive transcriptional regulator [Candidatus Synechococcus calcipolaris G9]
MLKIGEVAHQSSLPVKTIRYYDDLGLLTTVVQRSPSGYRLFQPSVIYRLHFIRTAQRLGLTLQEIREILEIRDQGVLPCGHVKERLESRLADIQGQIVSLNLLAQQLEGILSGWQENPAPQMSPDQICPNLQPQPLALAQSHQQ